MKPILLFDIDGTLLNVKREFLRNCIEKVVNELNAADFIHPSDSFAGKTDREIFGELSKNHPQPEEFYNQLKNQYLLYMDQHFKKTHLEVIAGVDAVLEYAFKMNLKIGLCTGNFRETAFLKVNRAGLTGKFQFGGFGCHHKDRAYLPAEAHKDFMNRIGNGKNEPKPNQYVVIGDTPNDIRCARHFGAKAVAVATGHFSEKELSTHDPDVLIQNLNELPEWLENCNDWKLNT